MTKVKICGFTDANNARDAALAGVDAIGLVFFDKSPRNVDIQTAQKIIEALPPFINRVGLFVNANPSFIDEILCEVALDTLQFHGDESVLTFHALANQTYTLYLGGNEVGGAGFGDIGGYSVNVSAVPVPAAAWLFGTGYLAPGRAN